MSEHGYRSKDGALVDLFDLQVEVFLDDDGYPAVSIKTEKNLSEDFIKVILDGQIIHAGRYHEDLAYEEDEPTDRNQPDDDDDSFDDEEE